MNRARLDICVAVTYLCTRVRELTVRAYVKLTREIKYLCATVHFSHVIGWEESNTLLWSIDASFVVHNTMKSHIGDMFIFSK